MQKVMVLLFVLPLMLLDELTIALSAFIILFASSGCASFHAVVRPITGTD
jgi:hypothetical protein